MSNDAEENAVLQAEIELLKGELKQIKEAFKQFALAVADPDWML